jgi:type I restriction enzyme R subunit
MAIVVGNYVVYIFGPDIAHDGDVPERVDYRQVILTGRLLDSIKRINPQIPQNALEEVAHTVAKPDHPSLI